MAVEGEIVGAVIQVALVTLKGISEIALHSAGLGGIPNVRFGDDIQQDNRERFAATRDAFQTLTSHSLGDVIRGSFGFGVEFFRGITNFLRDGFDDSKVKSLSRSYVNKDDEGAPLLFKGPREGDKENETRLDGMEPRLFQAFRGLAHFVGGTFGLPLGILADVGAVVERPFQWVGKGLDSFFEHTEKEGAFNSFAKSVIGDMIKGAAGIIECGYNTCKFSASLIACALTLGTNDALNQAFVSSAGGMAEGLGKAIGGVIDFFNAAPKLLAAGIDSLSSALGWEKKTAQNASQAQEPGGVVNTLVNIGKFVLSSAATIVTFGQSDYAKQKCQESASQLAITMNKGSSLSDQAADTFHDITPRLRSLASCLSAPFRAVGNVMQGMFALIGSTSEDITIKDQSEATLSPAAQGLEKSLNQVLGAVYGAASILLSPLTAAYLLLVDKDVRLGENVVESALISPLKNAVNMMARGDAKQDEYQNQYSPNTSVTVDTSPPKSPAAAQQNKKQVENDNLDLAFTVNPLIPDTLRPDHTPSKRPITRETHTR